MLLAVHFPSSSAAPITNVPRPVKVPRDPKKRAQLRRIEMMKMRHHAVAGDPKDKPSSILIDQRLHLKVKLEDLDYPSKEGIFWFRKVRCIAHRQV